MGQPITVRRFHIVPDEDARLTGDGHPADKQDEVETEAREKGMLVAVTTSCGHGWSESHRYDPRK